MSTDNALLDAFLHAAPPEVDGAAIRREWEACRRAYALEARRRPMPVWARRGFTDDGAQAWAALTRDLQNSATTHPYCIYVHVPFCANKCSFCDCYSFRLGQHQARNIDAYGAALTQEMQLWSEAGSLRRRPVSTVHLGGGTPTFLGEAALSRLCTQLRDHFGTTAATEWALETTTTELTDAMLAMLSAQGFTRLHLGVQSLEAPVRGLLNRREVAAEVLRKITRAVALGWVVSVDLIYGLPAQTPAGLLGDIHTLAANGVDGFSLYELQASPRNRRFVEQHNLLIHRPLSAYFLLLAASQALTALGYRKTLFNHFARVRDTNLYFTFPERGEDCLALGTIADGVFGNYHYRHPAYAAYTRSVSRTFPGLQGGLRRTPEEDRLRPLETALLASHFSGAGLSTEHLASWQQARLVESIPEGYALTASGSWLAGELLAQLTD